MSSSRSSTYRCLAILSSLALVWLRHAADSSTASTPPVDKYAMGSQADMTVGYTGGFMPFLYSSGAWPARFKTAKTMFFISGSSYSSLVVVGGSFHGLSNTPSGTSLDITTPNIAATYYQGTTLTTYSPVSGGIGSTAAESVNGIVIDSTNVIYAAGEWAAGSCFLCFAAASTPRSPTALAAADAPCFALLTIMIGSVTALSFRLPLWLNCRQVLDRQRQCSV